MSLLDFDENGNEYLSKFEKNKNSIIDNDEDLNNVFYNDSNLEEELEQTFNEWNKLESEGIRQRMKTKIINKMQTLNNQIEVINKCENNYKNSKKCDKHCYLITLKTVAVLGVNYLIGIYVFSLFAP
jgi:hypothetical protein